MMGWYAVHCHPNAEAKAQAHLDRQGFEAYLPVYLKRRSHARKIDFVRTALFSRYLFVHMDLTATRWHAIRSTTGVSRLVSQGEIPAPVPEGVIEEIRRREDGVGMVRIVPRFERGQRVIVESGAFLDQIGLFESMSDDERVVILLNLLGREVRVRLRTDAVRAAA